VYSASLIRESLGVTLKVEDATGRVALAIASVLAELASKAATGIAPPTTHHEFSR